MSGAGALSRSRLPHSTATVVIGAVSLGCAAQHRYNHAQYMVDFERLAAAGWLSVENVDGPSMMMDLAHTLGVPLTCPTGDMIKQLKVSSASDGRKGTLSAQFGISEFPLHTDTAFWSIPARFLMFRASGDTRRPTTLLPFQKLIDVGLLDTALMKRSVWIVRTPSNAAYNRMRLRSTAAVGWRFDAQCMLPANGAAVVIRSAFQSLSGKEPWVASFNWSGRNALIVDNWKVLHGRGAQPINEGDRLLERIYVADAPEREL